MKNSLQIIAIIDQPELLENKIEQLAYRHHDLGYGVQIIPHNHVPLETSSVETYVSGNTVMNNPDQQISIPFISSFVFTCFKTTNSDYRIEWSSSLT